MLQLSATYKIGPAKKDHSDFAKAASLLGMPADAAWEKLAAAAKLSVELLNPVDPTGFERHHSMS